jgi:hypothetical protein
MNLRARPSLAPVDGSGIADLEGLRKLAPLREALSCRRVQACKLSALWLKN